MSWSRGPKRIIAGGVLGHDTINVVRSAQTKGRRFPRFDFEDAGPVDELLEAANSVTPAATSEPAQPSRTVEPGISDDEVQRREADAFERGRQEGTRAADEQTQRLAEQLEGAVFFFHDTIQKLDDQASRQALELALMVAEKLFRRAVECSADNLLKVVDELVHEADDGGELKIVVDPITAKQWRAHGEALNELLKERPFEIEAQADLSPGDVIVHCGSQTLDERVSHRVRQYARALEHELGFAAGD